MTITEFWVLLITGGGLCLILLGYAIYLAWKDMKKEGGRRSMSIKEWYLIILYSLFILKWNEATLRCLEAKKKLMEMRK